MIIYVTESQNLGQTRQLTNHFYENNPPISSARTRDDLAR